MSNICYQKNHLVEVLARIDFSSPIESLNQQLLPENVNKVLKHRYPIFESSKAQTQNIIINDKSFHADRHEFQQWIYHGENREKTITVTQSNITVSIKKYVSYDEFKLDVIEPIEEVSKLESNVVISRTGLRYINIFPNETNKSEEVLVNFQPMISLPFENIIDEGNLSRLINVSEYIDDEVKCRVQSGMFNPDYPAKIRNKEFVLDIDAFIDTPHQFNNVNQLFDSLHSVIENKFEGLITDNLRDKLNAK